MYLCHEVLADPTIHKCLLIAGSQITRIVEEAAPESKCYLAGSLLQGDALSLDWISNIDLDIFVVFGSGIKSCCRDAEKIISSIDDFCSKVNFRLHLRGKNARIYVNKTQSAWIDISFILRKSKYDDLVTLDAQSVAETCAIQSKPNRLIHDYILWQSWLNLKLWNHSMVPDQYRLSSHFLLMMFLESVALIRGNFEDSWQGLKLIVADLVVRVENFDTGKMSQRKQSVPAWILQILDGFAMHLRRYEETVGLLTSNEHREWLLRNTVSQEVKTVFVSSRQREFSGLRERFSKRNLDGFKFLLAEDFFPWNSSVPNGMDVCEKYIIQSDMFIGIYGAEYGDVSPNRPASPIEEELIFTKKQSPSRPVLLFYREAAKRDLRLDVMLRNEIAGRVTPLSGDDNLAFEQVAKEITELPGEQLDDGTG